MQLPNAAAASCSRCSMDGESALGDSKARWLLAKGDEDVRNSLYPIFKTSCIRFMQGKQRDQAQRRAVLYTQFFIFRSRSDDCSLPGPFRVRWICS